LAKTSRLFETAIQRLITASDALFVGDNFDLDVWAHPTQALPRCGTGVGRAAPQSDHQTITDPAELVVEGQTTAFCGG
jgi:FMN phosphatase YigB (HAD superfamily)